MSYYKIVDGKIVATPEGQKALDELGITLEQLATYPDERLDSSYWQGCNTFVDQAITNGKGISWLDNGRIPTTAEDMGDPNRFSVAMGTEGYNYSKHGYRPVVNRNGRFPANLLVSDDALNDGMERKSGKMRAGVERSNQGGYAGPMPSATAAKTIGDSGSYSRYFDLDKWWDAQELPLNIQRTLPFMAVPKASKSEKNKGLEQFDDKLTAGLPMRKAGGDRGGVGGDGSSTDRKVIMKNHHPTVKPLKLMSYLITLFSRPDDTVLDPFVGSGTTCLAAEILNRKGIGVEQDAEYVEIAQARIDNHTYQKTLL